MFSFDLNQGPLPGDLNHDGYEEENGDGQDHDKVELGLAYPSSVFSSYFQPGPPCGQASPVFCHGRSPTLLAHLPWKRRTLIVFH